MDDWITARHKPGCSDLGSRARNTHWKESPVKRILVSANALSAALALALAAPAFADDAKAKVNPFDAKKIAEHVRVLSSDEFEGRGPATAGEEKTVAYIVEQMKAAGLEPGGQMSDGKRGWTQDVPLLKSEITGTPTLKLKLGDTERALTQGEEIAVRAALDGSKQVTIDGAPLVFLGYGVNAPERKWNDYDGVDMKGKIGIVLINDPDYETGEGAKEDQLFGGKAMTYYGRWTYKYEEAARQGAKGLLIVHETEPASYGWPTVKNSNTNTMFDIVRDKPGATHTSMEGWIQRDLAIELLKSAGLDFETVKKQAQQRGFKPIELKGATLSAKYDVNPQTIVSKNVAGLVTGAKRPDETVIYSGHWDHLGVGGADAEGDTIYNGAVDNATGIAALIEVGRRFASEPKTDRSIVILAVTAEEKGLLGSEYYAANPLYPAGKTVGVINMDALEPGGLAKNFTTSGSAKVELLDELVTTAKGYGLTYSPDPHPEAGYFFRSDHFPFAKRGVPAISYGSGNDFVEGGLEAGEKADAAYREARYHQPADEFDPSWTFAGMAHDLDMLYTLGRNLANSTKWPNWDTSSEFRAARDKTAADRK
jgi:Zn-dependent M28 family amino/carboxypeptidase